MKTNQPETLLKETITMYFGERHFDTRKRFDHLKKSLRRSRTGTLNFLMNYKEKDYAGNI